MQMIWHDCVCKVANFGCVWHQSRKSDNLGELAEGLMMPRIVLI